MKTNNIKRSELKVGSRLITSCGHKATVMKIIKGLREPNIDRYKMMDLYEVYFDHGSTDWYGTESLIEIFKIAN